MVTRLEDGLDGADVVMMLRVQNERFEGEAPRFPNTRELSRTFGLSERTLAYAKPDAIVMHPGPINRGVEIVAAGRRWPARGDPPAGQLGRRDPHGGARARDPRRPPQAPHDHARARRRAASSSGSATTSRSTTSRSRSRAACVYGILGPERRRQVDDAADDQRHHRARRRHDHDPRRAHAGRAAARADRLPARGARPVSEDEGRSR